MTVDAEGGLLLVALVGLSVFVFLAGYWRYPHLIFPVLVWTTLRFRQPGAVTGSFIVTAIAIAGAVDGSIPLADRSDTEIVEILEGLLAGLAVSLLILGAVLEERGRRKPPSTKLSTSRTSAAGTGTSARTASAGRTSFFRIYGLEPQSQAVTFDVYLERVHRTIASSLGRPSSVRARRRSRSSSTTASSYPTAACAGRSRVGAS